MKIPSNTFVVLRIVLGSLLLISGGEKLSTPYQNFLYVIQHYQMLPPLLEEWSARIFPWIEFSTGLFVVLGLWLTITLRAQMGLFFLFILVLSQALIRQLSVDECGCFGELISFPVPVVLIMDSIFFILTACLIKNLSQTSRFSLDHVFPK